MDVPLNSALEQIRQAALILAGQCIALLLHTLAQSSTAHATAATTTQGWRLPTSTGHGRRRVQVLTLGNVVVPLWLPYIVERLKSASQSKALKRKKTKGQGFYPFLRWLSMDDHITPKAKVYPSAVRNASVLPLLLPAIRSKPGVLTSASNVFNV